MSREYHFWTDAQNDMVRAVPLATNARESAEARAELRRIAQRIGRSPAAVLTRWYKLHEDPARRTERPMVFGRVPPARSTADR